MPEDACPIHQINNLFPMEVEGFNALAELALDLRWSWSHATDKLWHKLEPALWELTHNPWVVLQTTSRDRIKQLLADPIFRKDVDDFTDIKCRESGLSAWFQDRGLQSSLSCIAYFSMEFMLSEALPIYSGGLGNVAGDHLKAASDLGIPIVGVGLLYQQGYFHQEIDREGYQIARFPYNDPGQLPITPLRVQNGEWLRIAVELPGGVVWLRVWQAQVGRVKLYLLDSNDAANFPAQRSITSELYGGGKELRLRQEILLGIGGWRLLEALNLCPEVCHLNEGHVAFVVLERALSFMEKTGQPFEVALNATRVGNVFTTHTAVAAGFDRYSPTLIEQYLGGYAKNKLGINLYDMLALGRQSPNDKAESFNMAYLAIRGSGRINAVSQLHGQVSRHLFEPLFPSRPQHEVPIGHVTNGVHVPSWDSVDADALWTKACGKDRWLGTMDNVEEDIRKVSDGELWEMRNAGRQSLIKYARERLLRQLASIGASVNELEFAEHIFDPNVLTLGFARRFATYKRPNLLLSDPERLKRILTNSDCPVQLIVAGKAHPADRNGQLLIREWVSFIRQADIRPHAIFLADYDMLLIEHMVQGVDVWINTPRRPWEACGTSGMKVLVNGGINISELDGWWAEAYSPEIGWALGDGKEHGDDLAWDKVEAEILYELLEQEIAMEFYKRDANNIPTTWVKRMRESMAQLTARFSSNRAVREYTEQYYIPAAAAFRQRAGDHGTVSLDITNWKHRLAEKWPQLSFGEVNIKTENEFHTFEAGVFLNDLDTREVRVEIYADGVNYGPPTCQQMELAHENSAESRYHVYSGSVSAARPATDYTVRVVPYSDNVSIPLEVQQILWHS